MKKILILSPKWDVHIDFVLKHLDKREYLRYDPFDLINGETIDYRYHNGDFDVFYKARLLNTIRSVWLRRPTPVEPKVVPVAKVNQEYAQSAINKHNEMLTYAFKDALWISHPVAIKESNVRLVQMRMAAKLGFKVPDTLLASNGKMARAFVQKHGICIVKSQANYFPKNKLLFTKIINKHDKLNFDNLHLDPFTFQEYIEPALELRVTVVHDKVFAAEVSGKETDGITSSFRDWRYSYVNNSFTTKETVLSKADEKKCVDLVKELGLQFGALDFIVDKKGQLWFLEINPNGQWAFIEEVTKQPIGKTIAELLQKA